MNGEAPTSLLFTVLGNHLFFRLLLLIVCILILPFAESRWMAVTVALALIAGELLSRYLFFVSVVPNQYGHRVSLRGGRMNVIDWLARKSGLDNLVRKSIATAKIRFWALLRRASTPIRWVNSTCGYCSVGCGMELGVRNGKVVSVRGNPDHPVNFGKLCPKAWQNTTPSTPKIAPSIHCCAKNGQLARIGWDEAIETMVKRFHEVQQKYGPESLGIISTGQLVTEEFYALGKLVQLGFGTNNYDGNTTLCMSTAVAGYKRSFGSDGPPGAYEDLETADVILLIGANIAENHPILCTRLEANSAKTLIVADPRVTKTAMMADVYLPLKPRSDLALINAILRISDRRRSLRQAICRAAYNWIRGTPRIARTVHAGLCRGDHRAASGPDSENRACYMATQRRRSSVGRWASTTAPKVPRRSTPSTI